MAEDEATIGRTVALLWEAVCVRLSHFWLRRALAAKERRSRYRSQEERSG